jgi:hypothetical protein
MFQPGTHNPDALIPALLFSHGFSNGAVFWRTDCASNFQVGEASKLAGVLESLRLLRLRDRVHVSLEPTSVWRPSEPPMRGLSIARLSHAASRRAMILLSEREKIDYRTIVIKRLGVKRVVDYVANNANPDFASHKRERLADIERSLLLSGCNAYLTKRGRLRRASYLLLGSIARWLLPLHKSTWISGFIVSDWDR